MEIVGAASQYLADIPRPAARLWGAEIAVSLVMMLLVSVRFFRVLLRFRAAIATVLVVGAAGVAVGAVQLHFARAASAQTDVYTAPTASADAAPRHPRSGARHVRRSATPNCFRVLTDPSQSTC